MQENKNLNALREQEERYSKAYQKASIGMANIFNQYKSVTKGGVSSSRKKDLLVNQIKCLASESDLSVYSHDQESKLMDQLMKEASGFQKILNELDSENISTERIDDSDQGTSRVNSVENTKQNSLTSDAARINNSTLKSNNDNTMDSGAHNSTLKSNNDNTQKGSSLKRHILIGLTVSFLVLAAAAITMTCLGIITAAIGGSIAGGLVLGAIATSSYLYHSKITEEYKVHDASIKPI